MPESKIFDLTKIKLSSRLSPKDPKEFAKKIHGDSLGLSDALVLSEQA